MWAMKMWMLYAALFVTRTPGVREMDYLAWFKEKRKLYAPAPACVGYLSTSIFHGLLKL